MEGHTADDDSNKREGKQASDESGDRQIVRRTANDILCGRGVPILNYHGNIRLHNIIDSHRDAYLQSDRKAKPILVRQIVEEVKEGGARFLKRSGNNQDTWVEVSDAYAHEKVSHALRCKKAAAKSGTTSSSASAIKASQSASAISESQQRELSQRLFPPVQPMQAMPALQPLAQPFQQQQQQHAFIPPRASLLAIDPSIERMNALSRITSPRLELASRLQAAGNPLAYLNSNFPPLGYENIFPPSTALPLAGAQSTVDPLTSAIRQQRELLQRQMLLAQALPAVQTPTTTTTSNQQLQTLQRLLLGQTSRVTTPATNNPSRSLEDASHEDLDESNRRREKRD